MKKTTQIQKSLSSFSLALLMVAHSSLLNAQVAPQQENAAGSPAQSSGSSAFYTCLHAKKDNYFWTLYLSKSLPQTINSAMTVEEIIASSGPEKIVSELVVDSAKKTLSRFLQKSIERSSQPDFNLTVELANHVRLFGRYLRMRLKNQVDLKFTQPIEFELMLAPRLSDTLMDRRSKGVVPRNSVYPTDRTLIAEPILDQDSFKPFEVEKADLALDGITALMRDAHSCGQTTGSHQVYPTSILLKIVIQPDIDSSKMLAQFAAGLPTGQSIPFAQSNEQISFQAIKLPDTVKDTPEDKGDSPLLLANHFPVALVNVTSRLDSSEIPVEVNLGTLGSLTNQGWQLSAYGPSAMRKLPKLVGVPGDQNKSNLAENAKKRLLVEFNISRLVLKLDYSKYQEKKAVEVQELDLLVSAGLNRFPSLTFGSFSVASVDEQFKTEINKTIVAQIDAQEAKIKEQINQARDKVSKQTGLSEAQINGIIQVLFAKGQTSTRP